jgi:hypothetical protein
VDGQTYSIRREVSFAKKLWGDIGRARLKPLQEILKRYALSLGSGDLQLIDNHWYITHAGLLHISEARRCAGIQTLLVKRLSDPVAGRWVFKATVYKTPRSKGFVGYGDADPSNVSPLVRGAEMRVAETRAVNRALRKAYGIGLCSVEELGWLSGSSKPSSAPSQTNGSHPPNGSHNGQPRLRDQLCLLIRQYNFDPTLVKAYGADFCGTAELRQASRDLVESFISQLAAAAKADRDALVSKLNSYAHPAEVKP